VDFLFHLILFERVIHDISDFSYPLALNIHLFVVSFNGIQVWCIEQAKADA
jgi:hypothetical protein